MANYKYDYTEEIIKDLQYIYGAGLVNNRTPRQRGALYKLSAKYGIPYVALCKKAIKLGFTTGRTFSNRRIPIWSKKEIEILTNNIMYSYCVIKNQLAKAGFKRSINSIAMKVCRIKRESDDLKEYYSVRSLASCLGVAENTIMNWISHKFLITERSENKYKANYVIHDRHVYKFIKENAGIIDLTKVDKYWFIDILTSRKRTGD